MNNDDSIFVNTLPREGATVGVSCRVNHDESVMTIQLGTMTAGFNKSQAVFLADVLRQAIAEMD